MNRAPDVPSGAVGVQWPSQEPDTGPASEVVAFVRGRSVPCPRCAYDLRDIERPRCPECGEELVLKVGSPRPQFGWLVLAMAPGCFSGVAAVLLAAPMLGWMVLGSGKGPPIPIYCADAFGFLSAASVYFMYRHRHRIMARPTRHQAWFVAAVWGVHVLAFAMVMLAMWMFY